MIPNNFNQFQTIQSKSKQLQATQIISNKFNSIPFHFFIPIQSIPIKSITIHSNQFKSFQINSLEFNSIQINSNQIQKDFNRFNQFIPFYSNPF